MKKNNITQIKNIKKVSDVFAKNIIAKNQITMQMYQYDVTIVYHKQQWDMIEWILNLLYHMKIIQYTKYSTIKMMLQKQQVQNIFFISMFYKQWNEVKNLFLSQQNCNTIFLKKCIDDIETGLKKDNVWTSSFYKVKYDFLNQNAYYNSFYNHHKSAFLYYHTFFKENLQKINNRTMYQKYGLFTEYRIIENKINHQYNVNNVILQKKHEKKQRKKEKQITKKYQIALSNSNLKRKSVKNIYVKQKSNKYDFENIGIWQKYNKKSKTLQRQVIKNYLSKKINDTLLKNIIVIQKSYYYNIKKIWHYDIIVNSKSITNGIKQFYPYKKQLLAQHHINLPSNHLKYVFYFERLTDFNSSMVYLNILHSFISNKEKENIKQNIYIKSIDKQTQYKNLIYDLQNIWKHNRKTSLFILYSTINYYNKKYKKIIVDYKKYRAYQILQKAIQYKHEKYLYYENDKSDNHKIKWHDIYSEETFSKWIFNKKEKRYMQNNIFYIEKSNSFLKMYLFHDIKKQSKIFEYYENTLFSKKQYYKKVNIVLMNYQKNTVLQNNIEQKEDMTLWKSNKCQWGYNNIVQFYKNNENIIVRQNKNKILWGNKKYQLKHNHITQFYGNNENIIVRQNKNKILQENKKYQLEHKHITQFYGNNENIIVQQNVKQKENLILRKSNYYLKENNKKTPFDIIKTIPYQKSKMLQNKIGLLEKSNIIDKVYKQSFAQQYDLWNKLEQQLIYLENKKQNNKNEIQSEEIDNNIKKQITEQKQQMQNMIQKEIEIVLKKQQQQQEIIFKRYINDITNQQKSWEKQFDKEKIYQQIYQQLERTLQHEKRQWGR